MEKRGQGVIWAMRRVSPFIHWGIVRFFNLTSRADESGKLQIQTLHEGEKAFTVEVVGEDYSLAEIVHHELLDEKSVTFAGVLPPHPLIKKLVLKVKAQRIKPEKAFSNSVERAITTTHELLDSITSALGGESD
jgi:DNA-directed RNA polymerase subunit L